MANVFTEVTLLALETPIIVNNPITLNNIANQCCAPINLMLKKLIIATFHQLIAINCLSGSNYFGLHDNKVSIYIIH